MDDKLSIRVNVAERFYPLKISRSDEEKIRKAARLINEKVLQYKQRYTDKDLQDFLAMAALQFVIKMIECEEKTDVVPFLEQIKDLEQELEDYIQNKKKSNSVL
jgi:cell division protein ZapA (FtsZ GTPase activity inhibitor)